VAEPEVETLPVNVPPRLVEADAVHEVALVEVQVRFTVRPKLMVVACVGAVKETVGIGGGGGMDMGDGL
jgi:hypothetical protein